MGCTRCAEWLVYALSRLKHFLAEAVVAPISGLHAVRQIIQPLHGLHAAGLAEQVAAQRQGTPTAKGTCAQARSGWESSRARKARRRPGRAWA